MAKHVQMSALRRGRRPETVWDLPRNDVEACVAFYARRGAITSDEMHVMLQLQDEPTELLELAADWRCT